MNIGWMACHEETDEDDFQIFGFASDRSLFDFDLIVWDMEGLPYDYNARERSSSSSLRYEITGEEAQKLIDDRERRLLEIDWLMQTGRTLVILCPGPAKFKIDFLKRPSITGAIRYHEEVIDYYSFFPETIEQTIRKSAKNGGGKRIELRGDTAFLPFFETINGTAWYNTYFVPSIGQPFVYVEGTEYAVATWFRVKRGNIFLIPGKYDDGYEDCPIFVDAAKHLVSAAEKLSETTQSVQFSEENKEKDIIPTREQDDLISNHSISDLIIKSPILRNTKRKKLDTSDKEDIENIRKVIRRYRQRLQILREQEASQGIYADPKFPIEIGEIEAKITRLQEELQVLEGE